MNNHAQEILSIARPVRVSLIFIQRALCGSTRKINRLQPPRYSWLNNQRCSDQRAAAEAVFRDLAPEDRAWVPVGAPGKPEALTAPVASQFIDLLAQTCAGGNGGIQASAIGRSNCIKRRKIQPSW